MKVVAYPPEPEVKGKPKVHLRLLQLGDDVEVRMVNEHGADVKGGPTIGTFIATSGKLVFKRMGYVNQSLVETVEVDRRRVIEVI